MLRTLLAATTALTLMSGIGYAEKSYSNSTTKTTTGIDTPLGGIDISKTTRTTKDGSDFDRDHQRVTSERDTTVTKDLDRDHDRMMSERDRTVTKDTSVSPDGDVTSRKSETTTIR